MNEELRAELLRRAAADQEARRTLDTGAMAAAGGEPAVAAATDCRRRLAGKSLAGEAGADAAWLLAQHADAGQRRAQSPGRVPGRDGRAPRTGADAVPCPACQATVEAWPLDGDEARTAACPECGLELTFRLTG